MGELTKGFLLALVPALLVSTFTAFVTVRLSLHQFYSQRWWDKKVEAYSAIVDSLSHMLYALGRYYAKELEGGGEAKGLWDRFDDHRALIRRQSDAGIFLIDPRVTDVLKDLSGELDKQHPQGNWFDDLERHLAATRRTLKTIIPLAQADLGVRRRPFFHRVMRKAQNTGATQAELHGRT